MPGDWDLTVERITYLVERRSTKDWHIVGQPQVGQWVMFACLGGAAHYSFEGRSYTVSAGDVVLLENTVYRQAASDPDTPWHFISVGVSLDFPTPQAKQEFRSLSRYFHAPHLLPLFQELSSLWQDKTPGYLLGCRGTVARLLGELIRLDSVRRGNPAHYATIQRTISAMRENTGENINLDTLAEMAGMSPSYFRAVFKQVTGVPARLYQNRLRIDRAMNLLKEGSVSVTEAASLTGFQNIYYFSELFKKITGVSPSHFCRRK